MRVDTFGIYCLYCLETLHLGDFIGVFVVFTFKTIRRSVCVELKQVSNRLFTVSILGMCELTGLKVKLSHPLVLSGYYI